MTKEQLNQANDLSKTIYRLEDILKTLDNLTTSPVTKLVLENESEGSILELYGTGSRRVKENNVGSMPTSYPAKYTDGFARLATAATLIGGEMVNLTKQVLTELKEDLEKEFAAL